MEAISTHPGDYSQRDIDTRTKDKPSTKDLEEINQAIKLLMERYQVTPTQNPFGFLWLASLLYLPREKGGRGLRSVEHEY